MKSRVVGDTSVIKPDDVKHPGRLSEIKGTLKVLSFVRFSFQGNYKIQVQ